MYLYVCLRAQGMAMMWISQDSLQDWDFSSHCVGWVPAIKLRSSYLVPLPQQLTTCWTLLLFII